MSDSIELDLKVERELAINLFNQTWDYLDKTERTLDEDDLMVHMAHASRWHWSRVGGPEQAATGEWLCSRVYATLGRGESAMWHARRCLAICEAAGLDNYLPASAHEAIARSWCVLGNFEEAKKERNISYALAVELEDEDDRGVVEADLGTLPIPV